MRSNNGMDASTARSDLMLSFQPMQSFSKGRRQLLVRLRRVGENSVSTDIGALEHVQEHESRWLWPCRTIRMPGHGIGTQRVEVPESSVTSSVVRHMDLGAVGNVRPKLMDDRWAEVFAEFNGRGYWQVLEVLGTENDDLPLSYEEGDLVFGLRREVA